MSWIVNQEFLHKSAVSRFLIDLCAVVNKNPDHGADANMSRNSSSLAFTFKYYCMSYINKIYGGLPWCGLLFTMIYIITWSKFVADSLGCNMLTMC